MAGDLLDDQHRSEANHGAAAVDHLRSGGEGAECVGLGLGAQKDGDYRGDGQEEEERKDASGLIRELPQDALACTRDKDEGISETDRCKRT